MNQQTSSFKKILKVCAILAVLALIALGIATWALKSYLTPDRVRAMISTEARKSLQREVRLGGVSVGLVRGLVIKDFAISERPDFKAGTFASARSFALRLRLLPLLHREMDVNKVAIDGLALTIDRRADGTFNFSDLAGSTATAAATAKPAAAGAAVALLIDKAALSDARIAYHDALTGQDWKVAIADAKVSDFRPDGPFNADLDLRAEGRLAGKPLAAALSFSGKIDIGAGKPQRMSAVIKQLRLEESGRELRLSGKIADFAAPKFDVEAKLDLSGSELLSVEAKGVVTSFGPRPAADVTLKARTPGFDPRTAGIAEFLPSGIVKGQLMPETSLAGSFHLAGEELNFESLKVQTKLGTVAASGRLAKIYSGRPEPNLQASVHLDITETKDVPGFKLPAGLTVPKTELDAQVKLKPWQATFDSLRLKTAAAQLDASGAVADILSPRPRPQGVKAKVHLDLPRTKPADAPWLKLPAGVTIPAAILDLELALDGWDASIALLRLKSEGAQVDASGIIRDLLGKPKAQDLKAKIHLDVPQLKASDVPVVKLPPGLVIPASVVDAVLRSNGEDLTLDSLRLKTKAGEVDVKGAVRGLLSGKIEPALELQAKLDLPAFKSADLPFAQVPPGLDVPASRLEIDAAGNLDAVDLRRVRYVLGKNTVVVTGNLKGLRGANAAMDLIIKCPTFDLEQITPIAAQTRELKLSGSGLFALGVTGPLAKPIIEGKMKFKGLGATVAGLALADFTGTAVFDEKHIDIPNLAGKVADGVLNMDLTVKGLNQEPLIDLEASLDRFDLGKYLAAKAVVMGQKTEGEKPKAGVKSKAPPPISAKGRFTVGELRHSNLTAKDVKLIWDIDGITPDFKSLGGTAKITVGGGNFNNLGQLATQSPIAKILTLPFVVIQKIGGIGGIHLFPDFNNIVFTEIAGDYVFDKGVMALKDTHLNSDAAQVSAQGTINLPAEALDLVVTAQVANVAPMDIQVTGSFDKPKTKLQLGRFIKDILHLPGGGDQEQPAQPAQGGQ